MPLPSQAPLAVLAGLGFVALVAACGRDGTLDAGDVEEGTPELEATPAATGTPIAAVCDSCHPFHGSGGGDVDSMSGQHGRHLRDLDDDATCFECHGSVVDATDAISNAAWHANGTVDLLFPGTDMTWNAGAERCAGTCHGQSHENDSWAE